MKPELHHCLNLPVRMMKATQLNRRYSAILSDQVGSE